MFSNYQLFNVMAAVAGCYLFDLRPTIGILVYTLSYVRCHEF